MSLVYCPFHTVDGAFLVAYHLPFPPRVGDRVFIPVLDMEGNGPPVSDWTVTDVILGLRKDQPPAIGMPGLRRIPVRGASPPTVSELHSAEVRVVPYVEARAPLTQLDDYLGVHDLRHPERPDPVADSIAALEACRKTAKAQQAEIDEAEAKLGTRTAALRRFAIQSTQWLDSDDGSWEFRGFRCALCGSKWKTRARGERHGWTPEKESHAGRCALVGTREEDA